MAAGSTRPPWWLIPLPRPDQWSPGEGLTCMRGAIMASGARPRSAVELLIKRLVPFEQRPPARPIVQSHEIHRGVAPLQLSPFFILDALPIPFVEFGCLREERIKKLLSRSRVPHHSTVSMWSTHSNAKPLRSRSRRRGRASCSTSILPIRARELGSEHETPALGQTCWRWSRGS